MAIQTVPKGQHIVIIGGGHAAAQLVTSLRMKKFHEMNGTVTLISNEPHIPYQRPPLSKAYLQGDMAAERLAIIRETAYESASVTLKLGNAATQIDRSTKTVHLANGKTVLYDTLVLALGGEARTLPVKGANDPRLHTIRTLKDVDRLKPDFDAAEHIGVIGGGYIGLEAASVAIKAGKKVSLFESEDRLLARVVHPDVSAFYRRLHEQNGVSLHFNSQVSEIGTEPNLSIITSNGRATDVDLILVGIGLIPNTHLAENTGLEVDRFGICVDAYCQTSDPDIFAVGDVASFTHPRYERRMRLESVQNAVDQAKTVISALFGENTPYNALPWFWSDQFDTKLQIAGLSEGADTLVCRGDPMSNTVAFFYLKDGKMIAADCANRAPEFMAAKKLIDAKIDVDPDKLADESRKIKDIATELLT